MSKGKYEVKVVYTIKAKDADEADRIARSVVLYGAEETLHNVPHSGLKAWAINTKPKKVTTRRS